MSAAEVVAALFFAEMRFDPADPQHPEADRFVLSKGHAAPILYAAWAAAGAFPREDLLNLRKITSDLEGHPTPRLPFVDVATGSLGQGLAAGVGLALNARRIQSDCRTYVLLGDGETAEGSVWEAAMFAAAQKLERICVVIDYNKWQATARSNETLMLAPLVDKWRAFGWDAMEVDGHDVGKLAELMSNVPNGSGKPVAIIAHTVKGKGVSFMEDDNNWHYRAPNTDEVVKAFKELGLS